MRAPDFWTHEGLCASLLSPAATVYELCTQVHRGLVRPIHAPIPVICIGNLTVGGAGKTPVALSVARHLKTLGKDVHFLTRGYRGRTRGPMAVDPLNHSAKEVGDEPLLLAGTAPTWIARDRTQGAKAAAEAGAEIIVMDDGFQNPSLVKDLSIIVVDGGYGFGNGRLLPSGPLRENLARGLGRAQAVVFLADPLARNVLQRPREAQPPWFDARLVPGHEALRFADQRVVAFAGIGRPQKFFDTLRALGSHIVMAKAYPDHHFYDPDELMRLVEFASESSAHLVTTEKDRVRLPLEARNMVEVVPVFVEFDEADALAQILRPIAEQHRQGNVG
ncbi:MAG: tetraacyldisaccharide 4'-kinase [Proteobacteria bacterium]|nr:tetraacyldisaccharide 4'-kinase [Pseudomonadota bacterium]